VKRVLLSALIAALATFTTGTFAQTQADRDFYKGKTVTYIVSAAAGGGYDTYGRLLTRFLPKYMPGTRFIIRNVPGAGHIVGANTIYTSRPDGLTVGTFVNGLIYTQQLEQEGVRFDLAKMTWIGQMAEEGRTLTVSNGSGLNSVADLLNPPKQLLFATAGIGASNHIESRIMIYALDLNAKLVPNMQEDEAELSMLRGEIAGILGSASSLGEFVRQGQGKYILSIAGSSSAIPGVPQMRDHLRRQDARPLLDMIETMSQVGRPTAGPPGIPAGRVLVLRRAFDAAVKDPELLAEARKLYIPIAPGTGEDVEVKVKRLLGQPAEIVALLRKAGAHL
jgi:tripartite-type tricarboxylate transporter receptor subunit TctC